MNMQISEESRFDARYGYKIFLYNGVAYTPDATVQFVHDIDAFPMGADDVIVSGYPKSGTNWLNIVLANLYDHWETTKITHEHRVPELSVPCRPSINFDGYGKCIAAASPRLMKTHLPLSHMPRAFRDARIGKVVHVTRNPKDVCDSYFNNLQNWIPEGWTWDDHVDAFLRGYVFFGSWLDNVLSWHTHGVQDRVLNISYEEMKRDPRAAVERIVGFVGPAEPGKIDAVASATDFEAMKKSGLDRQYQPNMKRRGARVGAWKTRFTVEQSERLDAAFDPALRAAGIRVCYE
jgi:hypothetical protein